MTIHGFGRVALMTLCGVTVLHGALAAQGRGGFGGMGGEERKLVATYDRNADGVLDTAERAAARAAITTTGAPGGGPGGFGGGRGGGGGFGGGRGAARVPGTPGVALAPAQVKSYPESVGLYDPTALRTIFLTFENADWEKELEAFNNTDVDVPAKAIVDGKTYEGVGVHFRGASS